ncbi:MAG: hypothetical protein ACM3YN_00980 [Parcubacteria group bacterium]
MSEHDLDDDADVPPRLRRGCRVAQDSVPPRTRARHQLLVGLRHSAEAWWAPEQFGEWDEPWPGGEAAHLARLGFIVAMFCRHLQLVSAGEWGVSLQAPHDPTVLALHGDGDVGMVAAHVHGDVLTVDSCKLTLTESGVTLRVVDALARQVAGFYVRKRRRVS